jgi:hypothetical protein
MKNYILYIILLVVGYSPLLAQEISKQDSIYLQDLDEVFVKSVRVDSKAPITHSNVGKMTFAKEIWGKIFRFY